MLGSFFFFAGLAFSGSILFYRASRLAFPEVAPHFFRGVIFFLPSILFWPSSLGKDALIFFGSGFLAYGLIKYIRRSQLSGLLLVALGLFLVGLVRPHIAMVAILAIGGGSYCLFLLRVRSIKLLLLGWWGAQ